MLIIAGRSRTDGILSQTRIEGGVLGVGEFVKQGFGPSLGGQNALDRSQREGAEANGMFQGGADIVTPIVSDQSQQLLGLQLPLDLLGQQAVEELQRHGAELLEALPQQQFTLAGIVGGVMAFAGLPDPLHTARQHGMTGNVVDARRVDDDFLVGDAHRQHLADGRPRHRVEVQAIGDVAFDVHMAIKD